jgi:hypothetical protein
MRVQSGSIERGARGWGGKRIGDGDGAGGVRVDGIEQQHNLVDDYLGEHGERQRDGELRGNGQPEQYLPERDADHSGAELHGDAGGGGMRVQSGSIERGARSRGGKRFGDGDGAGGVRMDGVEQ